MGRVKEIREKRGKSWNGKGRKEGRKEGGGKLESFMQAGHGLTLVQRIRQAVMIGPRKI